MIYLGVLVVVPWRTYNTPPFSRARRYPHPLVLPQSQFSCYSIVFLPDYTPTISTALPLLHPFAVFVALVANYYIRIVGETHRGEGERETLVLGHWCCGIVYPEATLYSLASKPTSWQHCQTIWNIYIYLYPSHSLANILPTYIYIYTAIYVYRYLRNFNLPSPGSTLYWDSPHFRDSGYLFYRIAGNISVYACSTRWRRFSLQARPARVTRKFYF